MDVYDIVKTIGSGSFGQVYMARHKREGKNYVIKRVKTRDMTPKDLENTENEVRLLQKIRHTNIVAYKDSFIDREQYLNIVMIYCDGGDMYTKIKNAKGKFFSEQQILDWLVQMALALLYLHERKILHRDMKTQNIFLKNGKIRLGDFGIAKVLDSTKDFANTCIGTPYYMSPELFKNKPYSYKSDVWALGCVLYEMCNLRHAFDAQSINGLAVKILKGSYAPINNIYSKQLRDLITKMLNVLPSSRPNILDILNKSFVRKRVTVYMNECLNGPPAELSPTDVDDMNFDSLREQAEKLNIYGNQDESGLTGKSKAPLVGAINAKKVRKVMAEGNEEKLKQKAPGQIDEKKQLMKLKREIREKKLLEKKMQELENEAVNKQKQLKDKVQPSDKPSNSSTPSEQKMASNKEVKNVKQQHSFKAKQPSGLLVPAQNKQRSQSKKNEDDKKIVQELDQWDKSNNKKGQVTILEEEEKVQPIGIPQVAKVNSQKNKQNTIQNDTTSQSHISIDSKNNSNLTTVTTSGPISSYQEFAKIFNPKSVGTAKNNRKSSYDNPKEIIQSFQDEKLKESQSRPGSLLPNTNQVNTVANDNDGISSKDKVMAEKERRKREEQDKLSRELDQIRQDNFQRMKDAQLKVQQQYRQSSTLNETEQQSDPSQQPQIPQPQRKGKNKKIEEDYTMYDEVKDDELEDIIEEEIEEESEEEKDDMLLTSQEEKEERRRERDQLKTLKTQLMNVKERLAQKTMRIEEIKDTLKKSQLLMSRMITKNDQGTIQADDQIIDEVVKEFENQAEDDEDVDVTKLLEEEDEDDEFFQEQDEDDQNDDEEENNDNGMEELDPQVLKLQERVKFLKHRCVASLGNNLFDKAFTYLKNNIQKNADEIREQLIKILGEESIGFWAIMDQILFFEGILDEVSTASSDS